MRFDFESERRAVRLLALAAAALLFVWCVARARTDDSAPDAPLSDYAPDANYDELPGYLIGRADHTGLARWVLERPDQLDGPGDRNQSAWHVSTDVLSERHARDADYTNSGYSRGHLRPAANAKRSQAEMDATHDLRNIVPQAQEFNVGSWEKLEEHARDLRRSGARVTIVTMPCFVPQSRTTHRGAKSSRLLVLMIGPDQLWVPTHLAKSLLIETGNTRRVETYLAPNTDAVADREIKSFLVPTDEVEFINDVDLWPCPPALKGAARTRWLRDQAELEARSQ